MWNVLQMFCKYLKALMCQEVVKQSHSVQEHNRFLLFYYSKKKKNGWSKWFDSQFQQEKFQPFVKQNKSKNLIGLDGYCMSIYSWKVPNVQDAVGHCIACSYKGFTTKSQFHLI